MRLVADSSVLVAALVDSGAEGSWAASLIAENAMIGPELVMVEASNILRRLERAGELSRRAASGGHSDLLQLDVALFPFAPYAQRVWALRHNLTSYDAWYVALAETFDCPFVTLDRKISSANGPACEIITPP